MFLVKAPWFKEFIIFRLVFRLLLHLCLLICLQSLFPFQRGLTPPQCLVTCFSNPERRPDCFLHDFQLDGFSEDPVRCPLFHWCLPVLPNVSSRMSVLSGFLIQTCPCLAPYTVQEWHGGSSLCRWQPTFSGTHHWLDLLETDFQQGIAGYVFTAWVLWGFTCVKESLIVLQIWYLYASG
jgi:hypothetical protein